jgi:hypothetical protein
VCERQTQTKHQSVYAGSRLKPAMRGKVLSYMPAFQPYRGKPAVRNDREGRGNVGIIRSPIRASTLPDCGGRSVMSVPTAISEMSSQKIPLKGRTDFRGSYIRCSNFVRIAAISSLNFRRHFLSRARTSSVVGSSPDSMR